MELSLPGNVMGHPMPDRIGCFDIGGTKIAAGIIDSSGRILAERETPTRTETGPQDAVLRMAAMMGECLQEAGGPLQGVGIGCTGPVDPQTGEIGNVEFLQTWQGFGLASALAEALDAAVFLENDADAAALAEWRWGAGRGSRSVVLVTIGTGIGAGIIIDRQLYRGVGGSHPEIGHMILDPSGPACYYGGRGCWEELASGPALESWAQLQHPLGQRLSARELCGLARSGDAAGLAAIQREAYYLGLGLANLVMVFTPDVIGLGGGLMAQYDLFQQGIQQTVRELCGAVPFEQVQILPAQLGVRAGLVGAGAAALQRMGLNI